MTTSSLSEAADPLAPHQVSEASPSLAGAELAHRLSSEVPPGAVTVATPLDVAEAAPIAVSVSAPLDVSESAPTAVTAVNEVQASGDDMDIDYPPVSPLSFSAATIPNPLLLWSKHHPSHSPHLTRGH